MVFLYKYIKHIHENFKKLHTWLNDVLKNKCNTCTFGVYLILVAFPCFYTQGHTLTFWTSTFAVLRWILKFSDEIK